MYLVLKTDQPQAELYLYKDTVQVSALTWQAHKELADTIHTQIKKLLVSKKINYNDLRGIVIFKGPGSFTGLRIGFAVANTTAYALKIPIVATEGKNWLQIGIAMLKEGEDDHIALPNYGGNANITLPKK